MRKMKIKIGNAIVDLKDLFDVELLENNRRIMRGSIIAVLRKTVNDLLEFERRAEEELMRNSRPPKIEI